MIYGREGIIGEKPREIGSFSFISPQDETHDIGKAAFKIKDVFNLFRNRGRYLTGKNFEPKESILKALINPNNEAFKYCDWNTHIWYYEDYILQLSFIKILWSFYFDIGWVHSYHFFVVPFIVFSLKLHILYLELVPLQTHYSHCFWINCVKSLHEGVWVLRTESRVKCCCFVQ